MTGETPQTKAVNLFNQFIAAGFQSPPAGAALSHVPLEGTGMLPAAITD